MDTRDPPTCHIHEITKDNKKRLQPPELHNSGNNTKSESCTSSQVDKEIFALHPFTFSVLRLNQTHYRWNLFANTLCIIRKKCLSSTYFK
jgi:hypothetical protein